MKTYFPTSGSAGLRPVSLFATGARLFVAAAFCLHSGHAMAGEPGKLLREVWENIDGTVLPGHKDRPAFYGEPTSTGLISGVEPPANAGDNYGRRLRGWIIPTVTGDHTFWISGDDCSQLWLSTSESKFDKQRVASVDGWTNVRQWDKFPSQQSVAIHLVQGQKYYLEILHKDGGSADHVSVAWQPPGGSREVVPASVIESFSGDPDDLDDDDLPDEWEIEMGLSVEPGVGRLGDEGRDGDPDGDGFTNYEEWLAGGDALEYERIPGGLTREVWRELTGATVAHLTNSSRFLKRPTYRGFMPGADAPVNDGEGYGQRLRGYVIIPEAGNYRFHIAGDDHVELWIAESGSHFERRKAAWHTGWTDHQQWNKYGSQQTAVLSLAAGQKVYVEALHKEATGGDSLSIGWSFEGGAPALIPAEHLEAYATHPDDQDDDYLPDSWEIAHGFDVGDNGLLYPEQRWDADPDGDGFTNLQEYQTGGDPYARGGNVGFCEWHTFLIGPNDGKLASLTSHPLFAGIPGATGYFTEPDANRNIGDGFGRRIRGVVTIPATGTYHFFISGDDASALFLNPSGPSRFGKKRVAFSASATGWRAFTTSPTQKSAAYVLEEGQEVYFEALYIENAGSDHCSVGWTGPGFSSPVVIPSAHISVCKDETRMENGVAVNNDVDNDSLPDDWELANGLAVTNTGAEAALHGEYGDPDGDGLTNFEEYQLGTHPLTVNGVPGKWRHEFFAAVAGSRVNDFRGANGLLRTPDMVQLVGSTEDIRNMAENFGQRFRATLTAPVTGTYTFWIAADNGAELWLSTDDRKFRKRRIALVDDQSTAYGHTTFRNWDRAPGQKSQPITLEQGESYFIEVLHKEATGDDHVSIAWSYHTGSPTANWAAATEGSTATQSSTYGGLSASRAIDGNTDGTPAAETTSHTNSQANSWWQVDFSQDRPVNRVTLFNRNDAIQNRERLSNFRISVLDASGAELLGEDFFTTSGFVDGSFTWELPETVTARRIKVQFNGYNLKGNGFLCLAEVQAFEATADSVPRELIPSSALTSFVRDADDLDDDYLPDSWERDYGLSDTDNGLTDFGMGEYGDPDGDGLTNREEWLLGTDPLNPDTDGDGYSDGQEVLFLGTNPLVPELAAPVVVGDIAVDGHAAASATWAPSADGGVFSMETRGWIDYELNVTEPGYYVFEIRGRARGSNILSREDFLLDVYIDSRKAATTVLTSLDGRQGLAAGFAGWLTSGNHTIRIWNRNLLARRTLQLDSLRIVQPTGETTTESAPLPGWIYDFLTARNTLTATGQASYTSPMCLEGTARAWENTTLAVNGSAPLPVAKGIDQGWYANIPLNPAAATDVAIGYENGLLQQDLELEWLPFNAAASSHLVIRKDDSLRLTAFTPGTTAGGTTVSLSLNGSPIGTTTADAPLVHTFETPGTYTLGADYTGANGPETASTTIVVLAADFGPTLPLYLNRSRVWNIPGVAPSLPIENDKTLLLTPHAVTSGDGRAFVVDATAMGTNTVLARTGAQGPVLASGSVEGVLLSHSSNYELGVLHTYPNGDTVVELTVMASSLPAGGYIRLEVWLGGRLFIDGTTTKLLTAEDFDENGLARVQMILSSGIGTTCHRTYLHDAEGNIVGQM